DLALRGVVFGAVGTAGQRCTTTRRLFVHRSISQNVTQRLIDAYQQVTIGDPLDQHTLMGPLISADAVEQMRQAMVTIEQQGGEVLCGGLPGIDRFDDIAGHYVEPTIVRVPSDGQLPIACEETFGPILYVYEFD